ncbi:leucine-rich repeat protein [Dysgonomonas sp. 520]|uniref:leucine-rich repeat protein n=1 Tax=Dysgonomonas sp. 520 TaxID=2302931 RepID=UPI0013D5C274|nr:leucine-rich repeat protein [Dysgonomonas sp. 520]NDW10062.1 hypothetical protein [Dysgonomonas sp. 520]
MGTTADKLYKIIDTKYNIRQVIIDKGVDVADDVVFADYPDKIAQIPSGNQEWKPNAEWYDIKTILAEDIIPDGYDRIGIFLFKDVKDSVLLSNVISNITNISFKTNAGEWVENVPLTYTHTWNKSFDKPTSDGYSTRYMIIYSQPTSEVQIRPSFENIYNSYEICWVVLDNCNLTQISFANGNSVTVYSESNLECFEITNKTNFASKSLGNGFAFAFCYNLKKVRLKDDVNSLNGYPFYCCYNLTDIILPTALKDDGGLTNGFYNCYKLKKLNLLGLTGLNTLAASAFYGCSSLEDFVIPSGVTSIGNNALVGVNINDVNLNNMTSVSISNTYTLFNINFGGFTGLTTLSFSNLYGLLNIKCNVGAIPQININLNRSKSIRAESINQFLTNLGDNTGNTTRSITLHAEVKTRITDEVLTKTINKNYTIA